VVQSSSVSPFPADEPLRCERLSVFVRGLEVQAGIGLRARVPMMNLGTRADGTLTAADEHLGTVDNVVKRAGVCRIQTATPRDAARRKILRRRRRIEKVDGRETGDRED
jgi:hypothetical protein